MGKALDKLLQHPAIWRGDQKIHTKQHSLPSGIAALDALLPGGGWPMGALTEIIVEREGIGELRLIMPALAKLSQQRCLAWITPPYIPYAPALAAYQIDLTKVLLIHPGASDDNYFWVMEQTLRSGACGGTLFWPDERGLRQYKQHELRRLQLAAEVGQAWGVLFLSERTALQASPAALRLHLAPTPKGLALHILKRRGGWATGPVYLDL